jgi:hypothetical protein
MTYAWDMDTVQLEIFDSEGNFLKVIDDSRAWIRYNTLRLIGEDEVRKQRYLNGLLML